MGLKIDGFRMAAPAPAQGDPWEAQRSLALRQPGGDGKADEEIQAVQKKLSTQPDRADLWLLLGRAWIRKARDTTDPVYYLNARAAGEVASGVAGNAKDLLDRKSVV